MVEKMMERKRMKFGNSIMPTYTFHAIRCLVCDSHIPNFMCYRAIEREI